MTSSFPARSALFALLLVACGGGDSPTSAPHDLPDAGTGQDAGHDAGTPDDSATCGECTCDNGLTGKLHCASNVCECGMCPAYTETKTAFKACGGDPFGTWKLKSVDVSANSVSVYDDSDRLLGQCAAEVSKPRNTQFRLRLDNGGKAAISFSTDLRHTILASCASGLFGRTKECVGLATADDALTYKDRGCGECVLDYNAAAYDEDAEWMRSDTNIQIGGVAEFNYCVEGNLLKLEGQDAVYVLESFVGSGTPKACAQRTADECALSAGCSAGACTGPSGCETHDLEGTCLTVSGCKWDEAACKGKAGSCGIDDYGVVPGCTESAGAAKCAGERPSCESQTADTCESVMGCTVANVCEGSSVACSESCCSQEIPGCSCDVDNDVCFGDVDCGAIADETDCQGAGCAWTGCSGTPMPCSAFSLDQCEAVPGCKIETQAP